MKNLLITLAALMLVLGCKKERTTYAPVGLKRNFSFKEGSYWIYRDSISGREDSCYVERLSDYITNTYSGREKGNQSMREIFSVYLLQKPIDKMIKEETQWTIEFNTLGFGLGYSTQSPFSIINDADSFGGVSILLYNKNYPIQISSNIEKYSNFVLNGYDFTNVYHIKNSPNDAPSVYFNDSVGYIKMNVNLGYKWYDKLTKNFVTKYRNQVWELQRCKIIK